MKVLKSLLEVLEKEQEWEKAKSISLIPKAQPASSLPLSLLFSVLPHSIFFPFPFSAHLASALSWQD